MLKQLIIKNFTLIDKLDICFCPGFSVITGETGAGKSIILGAVALLLGQRADSKTVKAGADKCTIEAHFELGNDELKPLFEETTSTTMPATASSGGNSPPRENRVRSSTTPRCPLP